MLNKQRPTVEWLRMHGFIRRVTPDGEFWGRDLKPIDTYVRTLSYIHEDGSCALYACDPEEEEIDVSGMVVLFHKHTTVQHLLTLIKLLG